MSERSSDKNSMLYWYPLVKKLPVPQPGTILIPVNESLAWPVSESGNMYPQFELFREAIIRLGLPVFIRTDQLSGKHEWKYTCFLNSPKKKDLESHIRSLVNASLGCDIMGRPVRAFAFRKYLYSAYTYKAFMGMPVSPERRYFIENGKVICHHPYWIDEAIRNPSAKNWRELSAAMNTETDEEVKILTRYAEIISRKVDGFWSVDFMQTMGGDWTFIDMATGERSWHPEACPNNRTVEIDYLKMALAATHKDTAISPGNGEGNKSQEAQS
jgi:hypothetical protein